MLNVRCCAVVCCSTFQRFLLAPLLQIDPLYAAIFLASMIFPAIDTILKERVFRVGREIASKEVDLFIINTAGSALQAAFVFAMLPAITAARGMSFADLPQYLSAGWQCFMGGAPPCGADCSGAPLLPLLYVGMNVLFNVAALQLIRQAGNVVVSLVMSAMVPLTMYTFTIPIPFLDAAPPLGLNFLAGTCILMAGLAAYNAPMWGPSLRAYVAEIRRSSSADWDDGGGDGAMGAAAAAE